MPEKGLTEFEKGYIAGIIDGEGCLFIWKTKDKRKKRGYCIRPIIQISNTCLELLEYIKEKTGYGSICPLKRGEKHKETWQYGAYSGLLKKLLPLIKDKLIVKKRNAELILELMKINEENRHKRPISDETWNRMLELHKECKKLTKRGRD